MTKLEFLLAFSMLPLGALVIAAVLLFLTRADRRHVQPGE